jgi:hypothetical protein
MRAAVAMAILVTGGCGLAVEPARSQTTCSELRSMAIKWEFELMGRIQR